MSFREKTAWISMLSMAGIYGYYFWTVVHAGPQTGGSQFGGLLGTIIALVVVQVVLTVAVAVFNPKDAQAPRDEREKLIELRSTRVAYAGLATGTSCAGAALDLGGKAFSASITHLRSMFAFRPCANATAAIDTPGRMHS